MVKQMTKIERARALGYLQAGWNISKVAEFMGRHKSAISRLAKKATELGEERAGWLASLTAHAQTEFLSVTGNVGFSVLLNVRGGVWTAVMGQEGPIFEAAIENLYF